MAQMPEESRKFTIVDSYWRAIMMESIKDNNCLVVTDQPNMLNRLVEANNLLEEIQHGLNAYLEMKRLYFPRSVADATQGRINHLGAPYQRKAGARFSYAEPGFSLEMHISSPKNLTTFFQLS